MREHGLADAGNILDQQMPAREQAGDAEPDLPFLAEDDAPDLADDVFDALSHFVPAHVNQ